MRTLGAYEVVHTIKTGGMGEVLLARRRGLAGFEQLVAIKTIRADLIAHAQVRTMFLDEARLLARLTHPAIATVFDFGDHDGQLFLVMEYVPGIRFRELAQRRPPPAVAARAIAEACRGLHAAHELRDLTGAPLGVVHRDISPENLMLGHDGRVKVLDFGIALVKGRATVTEHGTIKGKPPYMSPEQARGEALDRRSDVFSIALVAHELLTAAPVFDGESLYAVARAVVEAPIARPSVAHGAPLPAGLDDAVMAALVRDPARRTATAAALADALDRIAGAAAGESLAAWSARELAPDREMHQRWLAAVLGGGDAVPRIGRPSGVVTAPAMPPRTPAGGAVLDVRDPDVSPRAPERADDAAVGAPAGRRGRRIALLALLLLALGVTGALILGRGATAVAPPIDARLAAPVDAPVDAPAPRDAAVADAALDARPPARRDAAAVAIPVAPPDAPPRPPDAPPLQAPPPDAPPGVGYVKLIAAPFANIRVDGQGYGNTPRYKLRLPVGTHEIELVSPDTGVVRLHRTVTIIDGQTVTISIP